ncbi:MAG: GAF domain-containing protein [Deltaproteobacteria bacterium]|nr:MAG: GAF domain-containing protein [Deltaproteobacteria bacterium]
MEGARVVEVGPVRGDEAAELARWCGVPPGGGLQSAMRRSAGIIGRLVGALTLSTPQLDTLQPEAARLLDVLSGLPDGVPGVWVDALPEALRAPLPQLQAAGFVRREPGGDCFVARPQPRFPDDAELRATCAATLERVGDRLPPLWRAVCALRLGLEPPDIEPARLDVDAADVDDLPLLRELLVARAGQGDPRARRALIDLHLRNGDNEAALALIDAAREPDRHDLAARVTVLRRRFQSEEAWSLVTRLVAQPDAPYRAWVELGLLADERGELERVEEAIAHLGRLGPRHEERRRYLEVKAARLRIARGESADNLDPLLAWGLESATDQGLLSQLATLACDGGRLGVGLRLFSKAIAIADAEGRVLHAAGIRMKRALKLESVGRVAEARRGLQDALLVAERAHNDAVHIQVLYNLARLELRAGRLPAAEAHMQAFDALTAGSDVAEIVVRGALNRAWLSLLRGEPSEALACFEGLPSEGISRDAAVQLLHLSAWASLELGRPHEVLRILDEAGDLPGDPAFAPIATALRGRAHLAIGRQALDAARRQLPETIEAGSEPVVGEVLLAWGGEDADPAAFPARREALGLAARFLRGPLAGRAARLRERTLDGPGAALGEVVALTEAMHDPQAFPEALARLVKQSLGAHRVLIMLRLPGLGNQLGYTELSGEQAAGIGREVLERIQRADDVWLSGDAFADPELRQSSQTVQTFELKSLLAVAIPRGTEAVGALYVDDMYRANRFDEQDVALLQRLARAVGGMIPLMRRDHGAEGEEPAEVLGVRLASAREAAELQAAIDMVRGLPESNLLITGPTGSGKSVLARRLATEVLGLTGVEVVVLRSGDPQMLVTQLFGSRRGEFTGAMDRMGAIERCRRERKALFLDEIQNLDETGQQILLPLLDLPRSFGGLTGTAHRLEFPLHVLLGTNHDVSGDRAFEVFRSDLWFRMSRAHVHLPPLADRGAEVVYRYLAEMLDRRQLPPPERVFETSALYRVTHAPWPGNLRELDAFAERVAHAWRARPEPIGVHELRRLRPGSSLDDGGAEDNGGDRGASLGDAMVQHVMGVLRRHRWVQKAAARELGMTPPTLNKFLKRNGLLDEVRRRRRMAS